MIPDSWSSAHEVWSSDYSKCRRSRTCGRWNRTTSSQSRWERFSPKIRPIKSVSIVSREVGTLYFAITCHTWIFDVSGPTYINMTIGSFVCTKCSGMLRGKLWSALAISMIYNIVLSGINPPHRIKSISMSSFTSEEVEMMRSRGDQWMNID